MTVDVEIWTIEKFILLKEKIQEQPPYQRGEVWQPIKKKLLIDSILRGIDIPKIYLRENNRPNPIYKYEIADGQQRINAIIDFIGDKFKLESNSHNGLNLDTLGNKKIGGKYFSELEPTIQSTIKNYKLTIAIVKDSKADEIRTLFGRLQMGSPLNPAEKRNAILCQIGNEINNFARNHSFFYNSRITDTRFRREDYMAHVIAYIKLPSTEDLKAGTLTKLYSNDPTYILSDDERKHIDSILGKMNKLNTHLNGAIVNKFTFIDFFILFHEKAAFQKINYSELAKSFNDIEKYRNSYRKIGIEKVYDNPNFSKISAELIYNYIYSFQYEGAKLKSIRARQKAFDFFFNHFFEA